MTSTSLKHVFNRIPVARGASVYYIFAVVLTVVAIAYGLLEFKQLKDQKFAIGDNQATLSTLKSKDQKLNDYYLRFAATQTDAEAVLVRSLDEVLPVGESYRDLTRTFDNFFAEHDSAVNPIVQTSLRFGKGTPVDGMPNIAALPITMNIEGTRENFFAFLNFINNSGTLASRNRLISISSIQLNFPDGGEALNNQRQVINVTLEMTAYYRTK